MTPIVRGVHLVERNLNLQSVSLLRESNLERQPSIKVQSFNAVRPGVTQPLQACSRKLQRVSTSSY